jgi:hypothetical protein
MQSTMTKNLILTIRVVCILCSELLLVRAANGKKLTKTNNTALFTQYNNCSVFVVKSRVPSAKENSEN